MREARYCSKLTSHKTCLPPNSAEPPTAAKGGRAGQRARGAHPERDDAGHVDNQTKHKDVTESHVGLPLLITSPLSPCLPT